MLSKKILTSLSVLILIIIVSTTNSSRAQVPAPQAQPQAVTQPQVPAPQVPAPQVPQVVPVEPKPQVPSTAPANVPAADSKQADLKAQKTQEKVDECPCLKPAIEAVQKAYSSLEEDEWPGAIKICKDTIELIKILSKTCKCPEVASYQKITEAFLKYAEGGNHLDGADEPNCPFALKLYTDAIAFLKESTPKITNQEVKTNATNIQEYAEEELQFVKDECQSQPAATTKEKTKGSESNKKQ